MSDHIVATDMNKAQRVVYVISDLHIGGRYAEGDDPNNRGFRINTHVEVLAKFVRGLADKRIAGVDVELIINGDFFDFLAEEDGTEDGGFEPFVEDARRAIQLFHRIVERDRVLFDALRAFTASGARLTLLLGNHDVELALPHVRRELLKLLGVEEPSRITFIHDGEAYAVGDALIEHGNRYDGFNVIDHDALRRTRSLQSRGQAVIDHPLVPPPGSRLVASIMNRIKKFYPFVDLLKPETEAVVPLLLALEPGYRSNILEILKLNHQATDHAPIAPARPRYSGDLAATGEAPGYGDAAVGGREGDEVDALLRAVMPPEEAARFAASFPLASASGDLAGSTDLRTAWGLARLLVGNASDALEKRLPALLDALRAVQSDRSFDRTYETKKPYLEAARELATHGFRFIVFGHTHLAKRVDLGEGRAYLNSGTWADLLRVPQSIVTPGNPQAMAELRDFVADLAARRFGAWIEFQPTYVRLDVRGERVSHAELCEFAPNNGSGAEL